MIAADFVRHDSLLALCSAFVTCSVCASTPDEILQWGGMKDGMTPEIREAVAIFQQEFAKMS